MKLGPASAPLKSSQDDIALLNESAEDGWELVAITGNLQAYLKKPVPESAPARRCCVGGQSDFGTGTDPLQRPTARTALDCVRGFGRPS
jgi:hypothetical protein